MKWAVLVLAFFLLLPCMTTAQGKEIRVVNVIFENSSGMDVSALLCVPAAGGEHPAIVGCGGWAGSLHQYNHWPKFLAERGYAALWIEPTFETNALLSLSGLAVWPHDVRDAIDWLLDNHPDIVDEERIGLIGHSLGAMAVTKEASMDPRVKAVVAISMPNPSAMEDLEAPLMVITGDLDLSLYEVIGFLRNFLMPCLILEPLCLMSLPLTLPISFLLNMASLIALPSYRAAGTPKELVVISGGTHNGMSKIGTAVWPKPSWELDMCEHYSLAWFDYYLKGDGSARNLLTEPYGELSLVYPSVYDFGAGEQQIRDLETQDGISALCTYLVPCGTYASCMKSLMSCCTDPADISEELYYCVSNYIDHLFEAWRYVV